MSNSATIKLLKLLDVVNEVTLNQIPIFIQVNTAPICLWITVFFLFFQSLFQLFLSERGQIPLL